MDLQKEYMKWFLNSVYPTLKNHYEFKFISDPKGDFGAFEGVQFDSDTKSGYLYFWSSGMVHFGLGDMTNGDELVKPTLIEISEESELSKILSDFLGKL